MNGWFYVFMVGAALFGGWFGWVIADGWDKELRGPGHSYGG